MEAPVVETEAYQHTRTCTACHRGTPCSYARDRFYGGGLIEVVDPGVLPADRIASRISTPTLEGSA